jgi:hypothetical protein
MSWATGWTTGSANMSYLGRLCRRTQKAGDVLLRRTLPQLLYELSDITVQET